MSGQNLQFRAAVAERLAGVGWTLTRTVDAEESVRYLREKGFSVNSFARQVLTNLAGLRFELPKGGISWLAFDLRGAVRFITREDVSKVEDLVGEPLTPVAQGGGYVLLVSPTCRAFLLQDEWLCLVGSKTLDGLLHSAFTGDRTGVEEIPLTK